MSATIGQVVWFLDLDAKRGPFPATVIRPGAVPLLCVHLPEHDVRFDCSHWLVEDGTTTGWLEVPAGGSVPADLFD